MSLPGKREANEELLMEERNLDDGSTQRSKPVKRSIFDFFSQSFLKPNGLFVPIKRSSTLWGEFNWIHDRPENSEQEKEEFWEKSKVSERKLDAHILKQIALTDFWASRGKKESATPTVKDKN